MRRSIAILVCLPLLLAGCADRRASTPDPVSASTPVETSGHDTRAETPGAFELAPPVTLALDEELVDLQPWTSCYKNGCADGFPPPDPYDVGDRDEVHFTYPLEDWRFSARFREVTDSRCGRSFSAPVEKTGEGSWVIRPVAYAGTYDVDVSGRGDGDVHTTFRWTTDQAGALPAPSASLSPVHDRSGEIKHWGVTLHVSDLADLVEPATGSVTVTAANGRTRTFARSMATVMPGGEICTTSGDASLDTKNKEGRALAKIGKAPFTYEVTLILNGTVHTASEVWPSPGVDRRRTLIPLVFDPPLPALE